MVWRQMCGGRCATPTPIRHTWSRVVQKKRHASHISPGREFALALRMSDLVVIILVLLLLGGWGGGLALNIGGGLIHLLLVVLVIVVVIRLVQGRRV